jgi:hypothetical protein
LLANDGKPARERLMQIRIFEELRGLGYEASYDPVRRYAKAWVPRVVPQLQKSIPMSFAPGRGLPVRLVA